MPTVVSQSFWVVGLFSQITLLLVLTLKRRFLTFPIFTALIAWEVLSFAGLNLLFQHSTDHYRFVEYWCFTLLDICLQLTVFLEIFLRSLSRNLQWRKSVLRTFYKVVVAGLSMLAFALFRVVTPARSTQMERVDLYLELLTTIVSLILFAAVLGVANYAGMFWTRHTVALAKGFALWEITVVCVDYGHLLTGWTFNERWSEAVKLLVTISLMLYWSFIFSVPERDFS